MGFPDYFKDIAQNSNPLRGFTCTINGQKTEFEKRTQTIEVDRIPELKATKSGFAGTYSSSREKPFWSKTITLAIWEVQLKGPAHSVI